MANCVECGGPFVSKIRNKICCGPICSKLRASRLLKAHRRSNREEVNAYNRDYAASRPPRQTCSVNRAVEEMLRLQAEEGGVYLDV